MESLTDFEKLIPLSVYNKLSSRITQFMPPQAEAIKKGLFKGRNLLISAPTASGKTLIAEMAILNTISEGNKAVYLAPLRALISEKYEDFSRDNPEVKCLLSIGDYNEQDYNIDKYDVIFASTEKFDSIIRNSITKVRNIGCIVYDEIHLISDMGRGPTQEFLITLDKLLFPEAQIIGLSATIGNADELAEWLGAELVRSDFRPIKLSKKKYFEGELINGKSEKINTGYDDPLSNISSWLFKQGRQALVFSQNKRNVVANAKTISTIIGSRLSIEEKQKLQHISKEILDSLERPTTQCEILSELVKNGVAFHHAGLVNKQRKIVENNFKAGLIKFIVATPTLAMGVNLPANTVIINSIRRYGSYGMELLPSIEIEQMMGRAGRPKYDSEGSAIIVARNEAELDIIDEKYLSGIIEPITSKFNSEIAIRRYTLNLFCLGIYDKEDNISHFFEETFMHFSGIDVYDKIEDAISFLEENNFVEYKQDKIEVTRMGKLINSLYIDPLTGSLFINFVEKIKKKTVEELDLLHVIFCSQEFRNIRVNQKEFQKYEEEAYSLELSADENIVDYDRFVSAIKMAHVMQDWVSEKGERYMEEEYGLLPGEFYNILENTKWLLYSLKEVAKVLGLKKRDINEMEIRVKNGVKKELIPLITVPDIGRVRARKLYNSGITSLSLLKEPGMDKLSVILGRGTAV
ncbi:MAG: DEAD/DEAH box helicase domain protein [Candidatus Parvarchaeum acidophilus ARMAN-5]|uniref:ATP-dependent DNA helicase Hel308 n=1 Tax=Candidatus Parvarchaeum acidophilus ARMAN-5 TaxID=662762 RepID=D6GW77_PARA5|nr:MAG: DEAD/DEAH box helicase domain protein [Candidatus Parvarchaeum acidophilus ARMAN-5]